MAQRNEFHYIGVERVSIVEEHFAQLAITDHVSYNRHYQRSEVSYAPLVTQGMPKERFGRTTVFSPPPPPPLVAAGKPPRESLHKNYNQHQTRQLLHVRKQTQVPQASEEVAVLNSNDAARLYGGMVFSSYPQGKLLRKTYN